MQLFPFSVAVGLALAGTASAETFLGELDVLLSDHPRLRASDAAVRSSEAGEGIAKGDFLPTLTVTGDAGLEKTDSPSTRAARPGPGGEFETERLSNSVFLTLNLFDGFRTTGELSAARQATGIAS